MLQNILCGAIAFIIMKILLGAIEFAILKKERARNPLDKLRLWRIVLPSKGHYCSWCGFPKQNLFII